MNKKRISIALFFILLLVMLPVCFSLEEFEKGGETLIIEATKYEPTVLRSDFVEQLNVPVFVTLGAIRGAPISVPKIGSNIRVQVIRPEQAKKENATVEGTSKDVTSDYISGTPIFYSAPVPTLDNLGYLKIMLKKIPKEHKVPETIDIDFKATIPYEAEIAGFTIGGQNFFELSPETEEETKQYKHERAILGGRAYIRLVSVQDKKATIQLYDDDFKSRGRYTLDEGEISSSISLKEENVDVQPERIRLKNEGVENAGEIKLKFKDKDVKAFNLREDLGNNWKVVYYRAFKDKDRRDTTQDYIMLYHPNFKISGIVLTNEGEYKSIAGLKDKIKNCGDKCAVYGGSNIELVKKQEYPTTIFSDALVSLERLGFESFEGIQERVEERYAVFEISDRGTMSFYEGQNITGTCKVSRVYTEYAVISGIKEWASSRSDTQRMDIDKPEFLCGDQITLKGISTKQKARITVLPGTGKGEAVTYFSVHIPIEPRAIQYTPEELQAKINRTQALIAKLDSTISSLEKLVEGWTKICLATAAVFTVMAFFKGISGKKAAEQAAAGTIPPETPPTGKEQTHKDMTPPTGLSWKQLEFYDSSDGRYKILSKEPYKFHIKNQMMYDSTLGNDGFRASAGAKFRKVKTEEWYRLTSEGTLISEGKYLQGNFGTGDNSGRSNIGFSPDGNEISIGLQSCSQLGSTYSKQCKAVEEQYGNALTLVYNKRVEEMGVWWNGLDGKFYMQKDGKQDGDTRVIVIPREDPYFNTLKKRFTEMEEAYKRGEKSYKWDISTKYDFGKGIKGSGPESIECKDVMSEGQCKILFNACDPVMCPSSRCDFNNKYRVPNVIQSGLIGSLVLCLPNIKDGVIMPVCLSGILASLRNIRSILQGYVQCLQKALNDDESVGICDRIRSVFICEIVWREAMTILGLAKGNLFDAVGSRGGGEYLGIDIGGGVDNAKQTLDFFTKSYASSVFASYNAKSSKELGTIICEKAIYGKVPVLGNIMEEVTKGQNPPQFTAYIEEQPYSEIKQQQSAYKLYYHIYAGSQRVNYKVYLKKDGRQYTCNECSGTLKEGEFVDKSIAFFNEKGYNQICVTINGVENCNFGRIVSTSFALSAANDYIIQREISKNIQTEDDCRADLRGYSPNLQIQKKCSLDNPGVGKGTKEENMWRKIGSCGKNKDGASLGECWIRVGDLAEKHPEAYQSAMQDLCKQKNANVCKIGEKCTGVSEITAVPGGYKSVICCYDGTCAADEKQNRIKELLQQVATSRPYTEMLEKGTAICEDPDKSYSDPFKNKDELPVSWSDKELQGVRDTEQYDQYHYFKGLLYLLCRNCDQAVEELSLVRKTYSYYPGLCGTDVITDGGLMFDRCQKTCTGKTTAAPTPTTPTTPTTPVSQALKLTQINFKTPSGGSKTVQIDATTKQIDLETSGYYKIQQMIFNKDVYNCHIKFGEQETKVIPKCLFTDAESYTLSTAGMVGTPVLNILVVETQASEIPYELNFNVKLLEESADNAKPLLCKTQDNEYFCIDKVGERCGDYSFLDKKRAIFVRSLLGKNLNGCKAEQECKNQLPFECLPGSFGYVK